MPMQVVFPLQITTETGARGAITLRSSPAWLIDTHPEVMTVATPVGLAMPCAPCRSFDNGLRWVDFMTRPTVLMEIMCGNSGARVVYSPLVLQSGSYGYRRTSIEVVRSTTRSIRDPPSTGSEEITLTRRTLRFGLPSRRRD